MFDPLATTVRDPIVLLSLQEFSSFWIQVNDPPLNQQQLASCLVNVEAEPFNFD